MRLMPSDPDVKTVFARIIDGDINLQPDFQRGEVWGINKKIRLIDSILREWHVPPIHVIEIKETGRQEVLDGQQRLVAIRDFILNEFTIDGFIEPIENKLQEIHGFNYSDLPDLWRRKFDKFTIRVYNITDYNPSEPGELFYRLNQPTNLTSAEQRNAFFGPARQQIKIIVSKFEEFNLTRREIGFSNSRMAYDDVIARLCVYIENDTLREKITASTLADIYRDSDGFSEYTIKRATNVLFKFSQCLKHLLTDVKFNKATLLSWLCFLVKLNEEHTEYSNKILGEYIYYFESSRNSIKNSLEKFQVENEVLLDLLNIYNDRASSRVADVMSVITRDFVIWTLFYLFDQNEVTREVNNNKIKDIQILTEYLFEYDMSPSDVVTEYINNIGWGERL